MRVRLAQTLIDGGDAEQTINVDRLIMVLFASNQYLSPFQ